MTNQRSTFGPFEVDLDERLLFRDGVRVPVRPQLMTALCFFVQHNGRVISRDELCRAVWNGDLHDDQALNGLIRDLRKVLDVENAGRGYIETIPRRGYRFLAADPRRNRRLPQRQLMRFAAALVVLTGAAVIALQWHGGNRQPQALAELPSAVQQTFIEGVAMFRDGERLRSRPLFRTVVDAHADFPDGNLWLAKTYVSTWGADLEDAKQAAPLLLRALALNPELPDAWVELGKIAMMTDLDAEEGAGYARRALQIDPANLDARVLLIDMYLALGEIDSALGMVRELEKLDPLRLTPMGSQGWVSYMAGRFDDAVRQCEIALGIGVGAQSARSCLYEAHLASGAYEPALAYAADFMAADGESVERISQVIDEDTEASIRRFLEWRLTRAREQAAQGGDTYQAAVTLQQLGRSDAALEELKTLVRQRRYPAIAFIASDPRIRELAGDAGRVDALSSAVRQTL